MGRNMRTIEVNEKTQDEIIDLILSKDCCIKLSKQIPEGYMKTDGTISPIEEIILIKKKYITYKIY